MIRRPELPEPTIMTPPHSTGFAVTKTRIKKRKEEEEEEKNEE